MFLVTSFSQISINHFNFFIINKILNIMHKVQTECLYDKFDFYKLKVISVWDQTILAVNLWVGGVAFPNKKPFSPQCWNQMSTSTGVRRQTYLSDTNTVTPHFNFSPKGGKRKRLQLRNLKKQRQDELWCGQDMDGILNKINVSQVKCKS